MADHNGSQVALILINSLILAAATVLVHVWAFPQYAGELFLNPLRNMTHVYYLPVSPNNWTMILWPITMGWLLIGEIYAFVLLCLKNAMGPAYKNPPVLGHWFLLNFTLGLFCLIAWFIVWDRDLMIASTVLIIVATIFCWVATAAIYNTVYEWGGWMVQYGRVHLVLYRVLWHNGMAGFTTWLTIQAIYSLILSLRIEAGISLMNTAWGVLGTISGIMVVWFILENTILDRYGRYTFTPYMVVIVHMAGVYHEQVNGGDIPQPINIFSIVVLSAASFFLVVRLILAGLRGWKCPLYTEYKVEYSGANYDS